MRHVLCSPIQYIFAVQMASIFKLVMELCKACPFWSCVLGDISSIKNHFVFFSVVSSILEHGNHSLLNQPLHVSQPAVEESERGVTSPENEGATNAILVEEIKPDIGRDMLELFFREHQAFWRRRYHRYPNVPGFRKSHHLVCGYIR